MGGERLWEEGREGGRTGMNGGWEEEREGLMC